MYNLVLVMVGGSIGAGIRHLANMGALRLIGPNFPWGTMAINIAGSFAMGLFIAILARRYGTSNELRLFIATGILGGFTTFSAFGLDALTLYRTSPAHAAAYVAVSVIVSLVAVALGFALTR